MARGGVNLPMCGVWQGAAGWASSQCFQACRSRIRNTLCSISMAKRMCWRRTGLLPRMRRLGLKRKRMSIWRDGERVNLKHYKKAPLPFIGQKRNFIKHFIPLLQQHIHLYHCLLLLYRLLFLILQSHQLDLFLLPHLLSKFYLLQ